MRSNVTKRREAVWLPVLISLAVLLSFGQAFAASFTDNGDGTVTDNTTKIMWQKCSKGQANNATCSGTARATAWEAAITYCKSLSLADHTDWRLPEIKELESLVGGTAYNPSIDSAFFPATVSSSYWSASLRANSTSYAWYLDFSYGNVSHYDKSSSSYVRCVRGGE